MTQIETFQNFKVQYVCVKGNPWFKGNDVAEILGYSRPRKAVQDHVPDKYRNTLANLMLASGSPVSGLPDHNDKISVFISEAGMYKLVLKSKAKTQRNSRIGSAPRSCQRSARLAPTVTQGTTPPTTFPGRRFLRPPQGGKTAYTTKSSSTFVQPILTHRPLLALGSTKQPTTSEWMATSRGM